MAQIKSAEADRFVAQAQDRYFLFLLYGPDFGLISERAERLAANSGVDMGDHFAYQRMDADEAANNGRLLDEANTIAMFGGMRLIRVSGQTRKNLAGVVKQLLDNPPVDCRIIIEAGDLKRDSALRRQVERHEGAVAIPCYNDGPRDLDRLITEVLKEAQLEIDPQARQTLAGMLGGDRRASRNEIEKLALYCSGKGKVTLEDVSAIVGDASALAVSECVDLVIQGQADQFQARLGRLIVSGESPDMISLAALRLFQQMQSIRFQMDARKQPARDVVAAIRSPLHFSRRDGILAALPAWPAHDIQSAIARLDDTVLRCRRNAQLGPSLAERILLSLALQARNRLRTQVRPKAY